MPNVLWVTNNGKMLENIVSWLLINTDKLMEKMSGYLDIQLKLIFYSHFLHN